MNHYIHLESTVKLPDPYQWSPGMFTRFSFYEGLKFLLKLIYGSKLVKYLRWGLNKSTFESFCRSFPTPSKISQLECLFTISNDKLPV